MSMEWVRKNYSVPAMRGCRVEYTGEGDDKPELGTVVSARGGHLRIRLDSSPKHPLTFHPTWMIRYLGRGMK